MNFSEADKFARAIFVVLKMACYHVSFAEESRSNLAAKVAAKRFTGKQCLFTENAAGWNIHNLSDLQYMSENKSLFLS